MEHVKQYKLVYDKRMLDPVTSVSVPSGYHQIADDVELLVNL